MPSREVRADVGGGGAVPLRLSSAAVLRAVLIAMVVAGLGYLTGNAALRLALPLLSDVGAAVAVMAVLRWYRGTYRPVWLFIGPGLRLDTPALGQILTLLPVYCIAAIMGGLVRLAPDGGPVKNTLRYMFTALGISLSGMVVVVTHTDPVTGGQPTWVVLFWVAAMLCLAGAALDPGNNELGRVPQGTGQGTVRLPYLGVGLLLGPVVGGVPQVFGRAPDGVMLCAGQAVMTVLVLVRLNQSERDRAAQQRLLAEQAQHDELTGLPNRRYLFELLKTLEGAGGVAVLFCDLNEFKPINDELGHEAGDSVLRAAAARLRDAVRGEDVVGRVGGDEFLIICPDVRREAGRQGRRPRTAAVAHSRLTSIDGVLFS
ncbi:GGDEF domain-containing protein [Actinoplanes lutulentus]|uniref:Diguanylate cyclase (GGDEF)-like protein n=1 Tax=Actinoplanes lutulentus TaxID=1287878 RepID=A0A327Z9E5_9ACTN|nr:GGDEF domain-containing protein [Actinoplanes lutulentus]MBB2946638.1 GGDEF domain-containing protein [Actinoplanes lutulentus]RAK35532.1 diguanylate cyclase (GGDEF)-like protein [Actinoplanes lutulentus]